MRKLIAALAIGALPAVGAVTMSPVSAPQAHAKCVSATTDGGLTGTTNCTFSSPQAANAAKDAVRDVGGKASGSPQTIPGHPKP
jgi:hypothetical protein